MVANTTTLFTGNVELETLDLKIEKNISMLRVRHANEEHRFIRKRIIGLSIFIGMGKIAYKFRKNQRLLILLFGKLEIKFLKNNNPFGIFSPKDLSCKDMVHGVQVCNDHGSA
jgi:hypothetical protein